MIKKRIISLIIIISFILPINVLAYSPYIVIGGETIGIEVHSDGVYVVGFYDVNGQNIAKEAGFEVGDIIKKIDDKEINNISSLNGIITSDQEYKFTVLRNGKDVDVNLKLEKEDNLIKTGLYVKDQVNGIGTLSYIDPETKIFGSLGHEILESTSLSRFKIKDGTIYKAEVSSIKKSSAGDAGEKKATYDKNEATGSVNKNEQNGIFGKYLSDISNKETYEVGQASDIKKGKAEIKTVIKDDKVETFSINIIAVDETDSIKNILFEITDEELLKNTGGVIQGMSGSPIVQDGKIIGVVNYVIVNETNKGYGIFITTMLEEGDKLLN